ncbi:cytochrome P450 1A1 [Erpetoichthys calabaricus]|uniref:Cytochrome P450 1A n=1 Tax=Erpetoichthys calabaricus TaxID=27687 RepID=A0A8C4RRG8_ERPCA|nr:cytochrome P450 1A1 [Erpetoichthys calabaricus]
MRDRLTKSTMFYISEVTVGFITFLFLFLFLKQQRNRIKLPGPWGLPMIGNILQLGTLPHLTLAKMRKCYGNVFQIHIGTKSVVVVSGYEMIKTVLVTQGKCFANRPDFYSLSLIGNGESFTFSLKYGESWKLLRKILGNALRSFSQEKAKNSTFSCLLEEHASAEAVELAKDFDNYSKDNSYFNGRGLISCAVANVVCAICFGKRYEHDDKDFHSLIEINNELQTASGSVSLLDFIPILRYFPSATLKAVHKFISGLNNYFERSIQEHYDTYNVNHIRDITDALINLCQTRDPTGKTACVTNKQIINTVQDIFGAGIDTVPTALEWSILYLITYPEIQPRIQEEIDTYIGFSKLPRFEDRHSMHFTEAFINEVFRHSSFVPFTVPHCTTADTFLNGYLIPKDTCIFVNMYQVNHDRDLWKNPELFMPERFLDELGQLNKEAVEKLLLFGMGVRKCMGEQIARNKIFVFLTTILQQVTLQKRLDDKICLTPHYGLAMKPAPFCFRAVSRI